MIERITERSADFIKVFAPAKINLFLAVTGKRADQYHELVTVLGKLSIGDTLEIRRDSTSKGIKLTCPGYPELENGNNLVFQAVEKWLSRTGENWGVQISLHKEIPPMSGLGGGSSDAVSALIAVNELGRNKLSNAELSSLSAEIGSDCPSFFTNGLCIAEGRGEMVRQLGHQAAQKLIGKKVLLFRPNIGLSTAEIYSRLSENQKYSSMEWATDQVDRWENDQLSTGDFLHNDLEGAVFDKHRYFPALFEQIQSVYALTPRLSGSGSACFVLLPEDFDRLAQLKEAIFEAWGDDSWVKYAEIIN